MPTSDQILGTGCGFPFVPVGATPRVTGADAVAQALRTLLFTEPGERIGRRDFGCGLRTFLFAPNSLATRSMIRQTVKDAVERHEPRVVLEDVVVRTDQKTTTMLHIELRYRLNAETTLRSLEIPFHLDGQGG